MPSHLSRCGTFAGLPDRIFEPFAERRLAWQLRDLLHLDAAIGAAHSIHLDDYRRAELHARQIADFPLAHVMRVLQLTAATRANQLPISSLAPYPQFERLGPFIDLMPIDPVPWPTEQFRQFVVSQTAECTGIASVLKPRPV
jgi:hypothetical protein